MSKVWAVVGITFLLVILIVGAAAGWAGFEAARRLVPPTPTPLPPPVVNVERKGVTDFLSRSIKRLVTSNWYTDRGFNRFNGLTFTMSASRSKPSFIRTETPAASSNRIDSAEIDLSNRPLEK